jgi:hypothetical protein
MIGIGLGINRIGGGGAGVPANALTLDDGTPVLDDNGNYILVEA